jgi:hypothetical protein
MYTRVGMERRSCPGHDASHAHRKCDSCTARRQIQSLCVTCELLFTTECCCVCVFQLSALVSVYVRTCGCCRRGDARHACKTLQGATHFSQRRDVPPHVGRWSTATSSHIWCEAPRPIARRSTSNNTGQQVVRSRSGCICSTAAAGWRASCTGSWPAVEAANAFATPSEPAGCTVG